MLLPGIFWINNIIFPEQNMLLFILLSLIEAKKYCLEGAKKRNFFAFVIFMNLALYTKEHAILLYLGILIVAILYHVYVENINFKSFIHPFRTIKSMPLEFMMFFSMWLYSTLYMLIMVQSDKNSYIAMGREIGRVINNFVTGIVRRVRQGGQFLRVGFARGEFYVIHHVGAGGNKG